ncbi:MAG: hypothetical protein WDO19_09845 [Bacteroidota bacterium]
MASTPLPLNDKLHDLPGIENSVSIYPAFNGKATDGGKEIYINGAFTGSSFFRVLVFHCRQVIPQRLYKNRMLLSSARIPLKNFSDW